MPISVKRWLLPGLLLTLVLAGCSKEARLRMKSGSGNSQAMRELGELLQIEGQRSGSQAEFNEGTLWLTKAAERGDLEAMYSIGLQYDSPGSEDKARYWYRKGAEAGDPNCMGKLAVAYRYGFLGLEKDERQYRYWMDKAMAIDRERAKKLER